MCLRIPDPGQLGTVCVCVCGVWCVRVCGVWYVHVCGVFIMVQQT